MERQTSMMQKFVEDTKNEHDDDEGTLEMATDEDADLQDRLDVPHGDAHQILGDSPARVQLDTKAPVLRATPLGSPLKSPLPVSPANAPTTKPSNKEGWMC